MNTKLIAIAGICFIGGTGGGAVWHMRGAAAKAGGTALHADSVHADSTPIADAHGEATGGAHGEEPAPEHPDTTQSPTSHTGSVAPVAPAVARDQPASPPIDTAAIAAADESTARLARIFGAMKPEEAARLLEPLPEGDVKAVLFALSDRKAAAILANFKGERATVLARALIGNGGGH